jgi:hypothetical protein
VSVGYIKAFAILNMDVLWQILKLKGFLWHVRHVIWILYAGTYIIIERNRRNNRKFQSNNVYGRVAPYHSSFVIYIWPCHNRNSVFFFFFKNNEPIFWKNWEPDPTTLWSPRPVTWMLGHCHLKGHLFKLGLSDCPTCERCQEKDETATHVLCECRL